MQGIKVLKIWLVVFLVVASGFVSTQTVFAGGASSCGSDCFCSSSQDYDSCRGYDTCSNIAGGSGNAITGIAFYNGGCGARMGTNSHIYVCDPGSCAVGGGSNWSCPECTNYQRVKECRQSCTGGWDSASGCSQNCALQGNGKKCCSKMQCVPIPNCTPQSSPTPTPSVDPSATPSETPPASTEPSPTPDAAQITSFEITNFRQQTSGNFTYYYQVLKEQMAVEHPNYQLNLRWTALGADECSGWCKYVKIDDYLANQNFDELQGQVWECSKDISGQTTFSGSVDPQTGTAKTKPREAGVIQYTLSCSGEGGDDESELIVLG